MRVKPWVKRAAALTAILLAVSVTALFVLTLGIYQRVFDRRFEAGDRPLALHLSDFPDLEAEPVTFASDGEQLRGNIYRSDRAEQRVDALLIFCHGFSNGSRDYLAQIAYFAARGFDVLAYDNTGCYESTGDGVRGMPQAVINLRDVLYTVTTDERFAQYHDKPLVLVGHSWGGYAVNAVLAGDVYSNVRAVVSFSAPNRSLDMLLEQGRQIVGEGITFLYPFIWAVERMKFGSVAGYSGVEGVNRTTAWVLALHSADDPVVSHASALAARETDITNPNAQFVTLTGKGHNVGLSEEARAYAKQLAEQIEAQLPGQTPTVAQLEERLRNADRLQLYELDETVLDGVYRFIRSAVESPR